MTGSAIRKLKQELIKAMNVTGITITKRGWRNLKKACRNNPQLDVAKWLEAMRHREARIIWDRMSPAERIEFLQRMEEQKADETDNDDPLPTVPDRSPDLRDDDGDAPGSIVVDHTDASTVG